ncbi:PREDICTED: golgin subfamily A member 2-like [Dipodomys ordii]|uniref:Golgin subfamily A member 2-like n=1 Tax=Dipodomys ordii TaxID=10020 RepID=A0A1S3ENG1_DIPOR|nr:PREDICTED: golgin subfamily A member 2-like [Dipodomys ordii]
MSEQTRLKKLAAGKRLLQEYQRRNGPARSAEPKRKKKTKKGGNPKTNAPGAGHSAEGVAKDHTGLEPPPLLGTVRAAGVKSDPGPSTTEDLERCYQHLVLALDASRIQNEQLCREIEQLKQENKELQEQQEETACMRESLGAELEQYKLSVQMVASEKSSLQSALAHMWQVADGRALERDHLTSRLQAAEQRMRELEMELSAISTTQTDTELHNLKLTKALNRVTLQLQQKSRRCEDLEDENMELRDRLDALLMQKANMKIQINKCQRALVERAELERQLKSMRELATTFKLERDSLEEDLRVESSMGKEKAQQLLEEVGRLREEKEQGARQVLELEGELVGLREQLAELQRPAGPSQAEQRLQAQALQWRRTRASASRAWSSSSGYGYWRRRRRNGINMPRTGKILETMKEQEIKRRMLVCNRELNEQLAQLQDAWQRLSAEKDSLAGLLHAEQQEKKHFQEKLEQWEETFKEWKEMAESKHQEAQELQGQSLAQLQELRATCEQHLAAHQQLSTEKEALQQHLRRQTQRLEQLQQKQVQSTLEDRMVPPKFQGTLTGLEAMRQENVQLRAQLRLLTLSREGGVSRGDKGKEAAPPTVTVPEDVDNPHTMWDFYCAALSMAESKKAQLSRELQEQQARCEGLAHLAAQCQTELAHQALYPKTWHHGAPGEGEQDSQGPTKRLKICFTYDLPGQVDQQSPADDLPRRCSLLSECISAMEEEMASCEEQMGVLDELQCEKEERVRRLMQEKTEKKKELQELLLHLAAQGTEGRDSRPARDLTPAAEAPADLVGPLQGEVAEEEQEHGSEKAQLEDNKEPAPREAGVSCSPDSPTAGQVVLLQPGLQQHQEHAGPDNQGSFPFIYRLDANDRFEIVAIQRPGGQRPENGSCPPSHTWGRGRWAPLSQGLLG